MKQEIAPGVSPPWGLSQIEEVKERPHMDHIVLPGLPAGLTLGEQIKLARLRQDLKQSDLAERAGIGISTLALIERGHTQPRAGTIESIVKALGYRVTIHLPGGLVIDGWRDPRIAEIVEARRQERGWTQRAVAEIAQVSLNTVTNLVAGIDTSEDTQLAIYNALWDNQARVVLEPVGDE